MGFLSRLRRLFRRERKHPATPQHELMTTHKLDEFEIRLRLRTAKRKPKPRPKGQFFKPRPAFEKRIWKDDAKPED
jgi:hypothetical protein